MLVSVHEEVQSAKISETNWSAFKAFCKATAMAARDGAATETLDTGTLMLLLVLLAGTESQPFRL